MKLTAQTTHVNMFVSIMLTVSGPNGRKKEKHNLPPLELSAAPYVKIGMIHYCSRSVVLYAHEHYDNPVLDVIQSTGHTDVIKVDLKKDIFYQLNLRLEKVVDLDSPSAPCTHDSNYSAFLESIRNKLNFNGHIGS